VLIVEDDLDAARLLEILLRMRSYDVSVAHDAHAALRSVLTCPPDVMLIDIGLPDVDGYELARLIRADGAHDSIRLVALTGYSEEHARARSVACGFDQHLVKPVDRAELEDALRTAGAGTLA
jgi:DNA-binding response OmpR family regulator